MNENEMALVDDWEGRNLSGWYLSEKLDGCRAYWDGHRFWTRSGNVIEAPASITSAMPTEHVDGEIWAGRGGFQRARVAVQFGTVEGKHWDGVQFVPFDYPLRAGDWAERMDTTVTVCQSSAHAVQLMNEIQVSDGEGLVVRQPGIDYRVGRSGSVLRLK